MGNVLSANEHKALKPHLQGIEPASLSSVIWDSINQVGVDDEQEKLGIHFDEGDEDSEEPGPRVVFWDGSDCQGMPRKVFLEVLLLVGESTVQTYEDNYDLEKSIGIGTSINKLKLAIKYLKREIARLNSQPDVHVYRERLDSGISIDSTNGPDEMVEELRARRGSWMWSSGEGDEDLSLLNRRRSTKGMEGVIDRLPELRRRYSLAIGESNNSTRLERVKGKIKALTLFQRSAIAPEAIKEEQEEERSYSTPDSPVSSSPVITNRRRGTVMGLNLLSPPPSLNLEGMFSLPEQVEQYPPPPSPTPSVSSTISIASTKSLLTSDQ